MLLLRIKEVECLEEIEKQLIYINSNISQIIPRIG